MLNNFKVIAACFTLAFGVTISGSAQVNKNSTSITAVHFIVDYSFPKTDNMSFSLRDTFHIYHYGAYVMYAMPHKTITQERDGNSSIVWDHLFYIYKINEKYGFEVPSLHDTIGKVRTEKATYLKERAFASLDLPIERSQYDSLVESRRGADTLFEYYAVKKSMRGQYFDTSYYSYAKRMDTIPYTFSHALDSAHGMKLYKALFIIAPVKQGNVSYPLREYSYELIIIPKNESLEKSIVSFIDKFKSSLLFD